MSIDPDVLERQRTMAVGQCAVCNKQSDAAQKVTPPGATLCGTDFDHWLRSPERGRFNLAFTSKKDGAGHFMDFVNRRQAEIRVETDINVTERLLGKKIREDA